MIIRKKNPFFYPGTNNIDRDAVIDEKMRENNSRWFGHERRRVINE